LGTDNVILTDQQKAAVKMVQSQRISILVGGPGTGKTTVCKTIIERAKKEGLKVKLAAPSGKAAKRMSEATGQSASTIHRLLEPQMGSSGFEFERNEVKPIECELVICDEVSMVANNLMADLLRAIDHGTKVLFIGDQDQLPSIGAGAVLRDFLLSKTIPYMELNKIHRFSGDIVKACHAIKHGRQYSPSGTVDLEKGLNLRHIETRSESEVLRIIKEIVVNRMPARGYDPIWDVQVISPTNERTTMSCKSINAVLQQGLNSNPPEKNTPFRVGDKAIQIKNARVTARISRDRDYPFNDNGELETYVVNGDLCQIEEIEKKKIIAKFFDPDRIVVLSKTDNQLLLAYVITCHRCQGSESPVVVIPVHGSFNFFVTRSWIYTAISRAKELCITVGQFSAINRAIQNEVSDSRITKLQERLKKEGI